MKKARVPKVAKPKPVEPADPASEGVDPIRLLPKVVAKRFDKFNPKLSAMLIELGELLSEAKAPELQNGIPAFQITKASKLSDEVTKASEDIGKFITDQAGPKDKVKGLSDGLPDLLESIVATHKKLGSLVADAKEALLGDAQVQAHA